MNWFKYFLMRVLQIVWFFPAIAVALFLIIAQIVLAIPLYLLFGSSAFRFDWSGDMEWWASWYIDSLNWLYGRAWP